MNQNYNLIEPYLDEELSLTEKNNFIAELEKDESLRRAVAEEKATRATLYLMMTNRFSERAKKEAASSSSPQVIQLATSYTWRKWAIAASVIGLIVTTFLFVNNNKSTDYVAFSAKYTYDYPTPQVQAADTEKAISDAFYSAVKAQRYDDAMAQYQQLSATTQQEPNVAFFHAFVLLKKQNFKGATTAFQGIANAPDELREPIEWYILMSQLGEKQDITAKLKEIAEDAKHSYQAKAKALLEEM